MHRCAVGRGTDQGIPRVPAVGVSAKATNPGDYADPEDRGATEEESACGTAGEQADKKHQDGRCPAPLASHPCAERGLSTSDSHGFKPKPGPAGRDTRRIRRAFRTPRLRTTNRTGPPAALWVVPMQPSKPAFHRSRGSASVADLQQQTAAKSARPGSPGCAYSRVASRQRRSRPAPPLCSKGVRLRAPGSLRRPLRASIAPVRVLMGSLRFSLIRDRSAKFMIGCHACNRRGAI
jgi:hypothetical protein